MLGHDKSKALDAHRPDPKEVLKDLEALSEFNKACKKSGKALAETRKAAAKPKSPPIG
jgi:hypothetical protein